MQCMLQGDTICLLSLVKTSRPIAGGGGGGGQGAHLTPPPTPPPNKWPNPMRSQDNPCVIIKGPKIWPIWHTPPKKKKKKEVWLRAWLQNDQVRTEGGVAIWTKSWQKTYDRRLTMGNTNNTNTESVNLPLATLTWPTNAQPVQGGIQLSFH